MARRLRVEEIGFYHGINRGVERRDIILGYVTVKYMKILFI